MTANNSFSQCRQGWESNCRSCICVCSHVCDGGEWWDTQCRLHLCACSSVWVLLAIAFVCVLVGVSPTGDCICVRARRCESYWRLHLCARLKYGAVGVVQSTAFVFVCVRVTGSRAIQPVCFFNVHRASRLTFCLDSLFSCQKWKRVINLAERRRGLFICIKIRLSPRLKLSCAPPLANVPKPRCTW